MVRVVEAGLGGGLGGGPGLAGADRLWGGLQQQISIYGCLVGSVCRRGSGVVPALTVTRNRVDPPKRFYIKGKTIHYYP